MKYSENLDYLVAAITYLGTHTSYWARTPFNMALELSLDEKKLENVFNGYPGMFRKSQKPAPESKSGQHFYSLQARYALRKGPGTSEPAQGSNITPLSSDQLKVILEFVQRGAQMEHDSSRALLTNGIAVGAAIVSAMTAIFVAYLKN